jgi:hypothetical protein
MGRILLDPSDIVLPLDKTSKCPSVQNARSKVRARHRRSPPPYQRVIVRGRTVMNKGAFKESSVSTATFASIYGDMCQCMREQNITNRLVAFQAVSDLKWSRWTVFKAVALWKVSSPEVDELKRTFIERGDQGLLGTYFLELEADFRHLIPPSYRTRATGRGLARARPSNSVLPSTKADDDADAKDMKADSAAPVTQSPVLIHPDPYRRELFPTQCPFCDRALDRHTEAMLDILSLLLPRTEPDVMRRNPFARTGDVLITHRYCSQHTLDLELRPGAQASGWPVELNVEEIRERALQLLPKMRALIAGPEQLTDNVFAQGADLSNWRFPGAG